MTIELKITPKATPYVITAQVPTADLAAARDDYWNEYSKNIPEGVIRAAKKGGFREVTRERVVQILGGPNSFYRMPVLKYINKTFGKTEKGEVLTFGEISIAEGPEKASIEAIAFFEPTVTWAAPSDLPMKFTLNLPHITEEQTTEGINRKLAEQQDKHIKYNDVEGDGPAVDGQFVVVDLTFDDRKRKAVHNQKVLVGEHLPEGLRNAIKGCQKGQRVDFSYTSGGEDGKPQPVVSGTVKVNSIYVQERPEINDDLAISSGFENLEQMKNVYMREVEDQFTRDRESQIMNHVITTLNTQCDVTPIPSAWADAKAHELFDQQKQVYGGEKQVMQMFGTDDVGQIIAFNANDIARAFMRSLILRAYGIATGIDGDLSLGATHRYADTVAKEILSKRVVIEEATDAASAS